MLNHRLALSALLAGLLVATASPLAVAHDPSDAPAPTDRFESFLRAIDVVPPSAAALLAAFPDAQARLIAAAEDASRDGWTRQRAVTLLSFFPDSETREALRRLAGGTDPSIRSLSVYTLGRAYGGLSGAQADPVITTLEVALQDAEPIVRDKAVRALRWTRDARAEALLDRAGQRAELKGLVDATRRKRARRLAADRP